MTRSSYDNSRPELLRGRPSFLDASRQMYVHVTQVLVLFCVAVTAFAEPAHPPLSPTNIFAPVSTPAQSIFDLSRFVLMVTAAIFIVVFSLLAYAVVKFRKSTADDGREPAQVYGSTQLELAWTVIPVLIVVLVGVSISVAKGSHGERTTHPGKRPGTPDSDFPYATFLRHGSQLLGASPGRKDGPDTEPPQ